MRTFYYSSSLLFFLCFLFSCSPRKVDPVVVDAEGRLTLRVPELPASLTDSVEAANYRVSHYWDYMDFSVDSLTHNRDFMERSIRGYLHLFSWADSGAIARSVREVLARAEADTMAYASFMVVPERYLIDENSWRQEQYVYFADAFLASSFVTETDKEIPRFYRDIVLKNRVGTPATDIAYETADGDSARLSDLRGVPTLLYFYGVDCGMCTAGMKYLADNDHLTELVTDRKLQVLALARSGTHERWQEMIPTLPEGWIAGSSFTELADLDLYAIFHVPTLYLVDAAGRVVLKDVQLRDLLIWLYRHDLPADPRPLRVG